MSLEFAEVRRGGDGRYAVIAFRDGYERELGIFDTEEEAQSWLLAENIDFDRSGSDLGIVKPGGGQGL